MYDQQMSATGVTRQMTAAYASNGIATPLLRRRKRGRAVARALVRTRQEALQVDRATMVG
jgi:hypothetical protein